MSRGNLDRRTFIKGAGVAAGAAFVPGTASAVDDALDTDGGLQEVVVVFESNEAVDDLAAFDLPDGYYRYRVLPFGYTRATGEQIERIADLESVRRVRKNEELELHNDDARELTGAEAVQTDPGIRGEDVTVAVLDTGVTFHPDLEDSVVENRQFLNPLAPGNDDQVWVDVRSEAVNPDGDDAGHGSHVTGTIAGDGTQSDGAYRGMAPEADVISYSTNIGIYVAYLAAAIDDLVARQQAGEVDVQLINNSFGLSHDGDFNPADPTHLAYWTAFEEGILPVFSAGNSGPDHGTLNYLGKQPYSLCVAATHTGDFGESKAPTDFSSRGRPPVSDADAQYAQDYDFEKYDNNEGPNYDRRTALRNVRAFHETRRTPRRVWTDEVSATVEATASDPLGFTQVGGDPTYVEWESPREAGYLEAEFELTPPRQSVSVVLRRGGEDGQRIADGGGLINDDTISLDALVEPETTYTFEFTGFNNVETQVDGELRTYNRVSRPDGPFGMYRCDVGAPGNEIISTMTPREWLYPLGTFFQADGQLTDPWYESLSGTSMSCPATVGVCALVAQAYRNEAGYFPKPVDLINIVEATAEGGTDEELEVHSEANMGAGFVDAEAAVDLARELGDRAPPEGPASDDPAVAQHPNLWNRVELCSREDTDPAETPLEVEGGVETDSSVYTAGQTAASDIDVAVESPEGEAVVVADFVPEAWDVDEEYGDVEETVPALGGTFVLFGVEDAGDSYDVTHFAEAPEAAEDTGEYTLGPVAVARAADFGGPVDEVEWTVLEGTERDVTVVGVDT